MNFVQRFARNDCPGRDCRRAPAFFWRRKLWWMTRWSPCSVLGVLVIFGQSSAISAFIYTIF